MIVMLQFVPERRRLSSVLHMPAFVLLRIALLYRSNIVITDVPYQIA